MSRFLAHLKAFALTLGSLGGPGLALLTFLDSSVLPLPGNDILLMVLVGRHPDRWPYYAAMATGGSLAGCYLLYALARKGGHAFLTKYLHERHIERGMERFRKYGLLTVVVPAILPPPMPFKPFVLFAGVADVKPHVFIGAILLGRGFRYGVEGLLAFFYGKGAIDFAEQNMKAVSLAFASVVAVVFVSTLLWRRRGRS